MRQRNRGIYRYGLPAFMYRATKLWTEWELREARQAGQRIQEALNWK